MPYRRSDLDSRQGRGFSSPLAFVFSTDDSSRGIRLRRSQLLNARFVVATKIEGAAYLFISGRHTSHTVETLRGIERRQPISRPTGSLDSAISRRRLAQESRSIRVSQRDRRSRDRHTPREHRSGHGVTFLSVPAVDALAHRSQGQRARPRHDATRRAAERKERSSHVTIPKMHCSRFQSSFLRSFTATPPRIGEITRSAAMSLLRARDGECLSPARLLECQGQPAPVYAPRRAASPRRATQFPMGEMREHARARASRFTTNRRDDLNRHTLTVRERGTVCDGKGAQCNARTSTPRLPHSCFLFSAAAASSSSSSTSSTLSVRSFFLFLPLPRRNGRDGRAHGRTKNARSHVGCTSH